MNTFARHCGIPGDAELTSKKKKSNFAPSRAFNVMQIDSPEVFVGIFRIIDEGNVTERGEVKSQVFTVTCGG